MTATTTIQTTGQDHHEVDTSLLDAAREIAPIIQAHSDEAEREEEASTPPVTRRLTKQEKKALRRRLRKQQEKRAGG